MDTIFNFDQSPPIISRDHGDYKEPLPGLRVLRDEFLREPASSAPSTNAPYLAAVWDELVHTRHPVAVYRTFYPADGQDKMRRRGTSIRAVKVDVVAENGTRWVRVNTIKNSRLMMEFREIDSYLTSDDDENNSRPRAAPEFDNSVLRMGRELLAAAKGNPISVHGVDSNTTVTPQITIRLTRLDPSPTDDPRIGKTVQYLRDMGIDVQLGERHTPSIPKMPLKPRLLQPTTSINLDLSALIALISDISHSSLPGTEQEAHTRFGPPQYYLDWKKDRAKSLAHRNHHSLDNMDAGDDGGTSENLRQHSRALAAQTIQEMNKGILEEVHERTLGTISIPLTNLTFWTTSEARHRCLQIVSKIGGEQERRRADALLGSTCCARTPSVPAPAQTAGCVSELAREMEGAASLDGYWEHSRYPTGFLPLPPVHVYSSIRPDVGEEQRSISSFFDALAQTCTQILSYEDTPSASSATEQVLEEIPSALQTSLPKLTVHTVTSMLAGASRGYTTLTTNKGSVKAIVKEMRRVYGRGACDPCDSEVEEAALWVLGPRSLSGGMRSE